jgi:Zn-dependent protease
MDLDSAFVRDGLITFILLLVSIVFHEWGHAVVADILGDDTPRTEGRVTLNPLAHLELVGTVIIPLLNIFVFRGGFNFIGWGRPVSVNASNFKNRARDDILVTLAGPAANLVLALVSIIVGAMIISSNQRMGELVYGLVVMNVGLAVFNLIPIPPLDGATILRRLVGMSEETYYGIARWSGVILLLMINLRPTQYLIAVAVDFACIPYALLWHAISPPAFRSMFPL